MKRLCVFYYKARDWVGKPVEWIVCKECQKQLRKGEVLHAHLEKLIMEEYHDWDGTKKISRFDQTESC